MEHVLIEVWKVIFLSIHGWFVGSSRSSFRVYSASSQIHEHRKDGRNGRERICIHPCSKSVICLWSYGLIMSCHHRGKPPLNPCKSRSPWGFSSPKFLTVRPWKRYIYIYIHLPKRNLQLKPAISTVNPLAASRQLRNNGQWAFRKSMEPERMEVLEQIMKEHPVRHVPCLPGDVLVSGGMPKVVEQFGWIMWILTRILISCPRPRPSNLRIALRKWYPSNLQRIWLPVW